MTGGHAVSSPELRVTVHDRRILRELGRRMAEIAADPVNEERRRLWLLHDEGHGERPMVLTEPYVAFEQSPASRLACEEEWARRIEFELRRNVFRFEEIRDDWVFDPFVDCPWKIELGDFGVRAETHWAERPAEANVASRCWTPPLANLESDLDRLRHREFRVDRTATAIRRAALEETFDAVLGVRPRTLPFWTTGMTLDAIDLVGLEPLMRYMRTQPESVHRLMAFLRDDYLALFQWLETERLLTLNNSSDYIGSGSIGLTRALPQPGWREGDPVRMRDLWGLCESQETALVGPVEFEEFVFQYQLPVITSFGCAYYGCCEPLHLRWHIVKRIPNLKRVSVSPWADQRFMAEAVRRDYVYARKPNPALISTSLFDEDAIRRDLRETLQIARGCNVEIIMKDVHTLAGHPERQARWVELARQEIDLIW